MESNRIIALYRFVICIGVFLSTTFYAIAQPANDSCLTATDITANLNIGSCTTYSTLGATNDITPSCDTAFCGGGPANNLNTNVWFSFVAPSTGDLTISINLYAWNTPNYDPIIALYTSCDSLSQIGCSPINDDGSNQDGSKIASFPGLVNGNTYYISVDPPCSDSGSFCMQIDYLSHCLNGVQDFDETGIDCGGAQCAECSPNGTTFQKAYGGIYNDYGTYATQTFDGGYIALGHAESFGQGSWDMYLVKTDVKGDTIWTRTYGGVLTDFSNMVLQSADSGYVLVGYTNMGPGGPSMYVVKVNSLGDSLWSHAYGSSLNDAAYALEATTDGGFVVCGYTYGIGAGSGDGYLLKINGVGDTVWSRSYGGTSNENFLDVDQTIDGGFIMTGNTGSYGAGGNDVYLVKTDSLGDTLWTRTYGNSGHDFGEEVIEVNSGGYLITGYTDMGPGTNAVYLIRTDINGDSLWSRTYGGTSAEVGRSLIENSSGEFIIVGYTTSFGQGQKDVYFLKVDAGGDVLVAKTFGGISNDEALSIQTCTDEGYIIGGNTLSMGSSNIMVYLIKTDADGNAIGCNQGGTGTVMEIPNTLVGSTNTIIDTGVVDTVVSANATQTQTLVFGTGLNIVLSSSDISCFNANDGQASVTVSCGADPLTYLWSDGQTTSAATGLSAGSYDLLVSDSLGSVDSVVFSIFQPSQITSTFNSEYQLCTGSDGSINAWTTGGSGSGPYSYLWSNGDTTANPLGLSAGMYYVTVTDTGGCFITDSAEVLFHEDSLIISINSTPVICDGICSGSLDVSVGGGNVPYSYSWDDPGTQSTDTAIGLCPGPYNVTITDTYGCIGVDSAEVMVDSMPVQEICMVTVDSTSTRNLIVWEKPSMAGIDYYNIYREVSTNVYVNVGSVPYGGLSEFADTTNGVNPATTAYRYKISVVDTCGMENALSGSHKTIHMVISVDVFNRPVLSWNDYEGVLIANYRILRDSTGTNIWQVLDSVPFGVNSWTDLNPPGSPNLTYLIEVVLPNTCTSTKVSLYASTRSNSLLNGDLFNAVTSSTDASVGVCDGSVSVAANYGLLPYTYMWNTVPVGSTASVDSLCQGTYTVIVIDANGDTVIVSATVNQPNSMAATISSTNPSVGNCDGVLAVTASAGVPPYTYLWNTSPTQTTSTIDSLCQGTYTVTVTDNLGDTIVLTSSIIESVAPMSGSVTSIYATVGNCDGSATVLVSGGGLPYTYLWNSVPPQTTATADSLCPGTYVVTAYDSLGDSISFTVTVIEATAPMTTATSSSDASVAMCDGTASVVVSGGAPPYTYIWNDSLSQTTTTAVGLCQGTYNVTVFDSTGNTVVAAVTVNGPPVGSVPISDFIASQVSIVVGQSIDYLDLTQNNPTSWVWLLSGANPSFSTDQNPTNITYNTVGCFDAQLVATNLAGTDTIFKTCYIDVGAVSVDEMDLRDEIKVYPNPSDGVFSIQIDNSNALDYDIIVNDLIGREIYKAEMTTNPGKSSALIVVDLSDQPLGIYELVVSSKGHKVVRKLIFK